MRGGGYGYSKEGPYGERGALDEAIQVASGIGRLERPGQQPSAQFAHGPMADKTNSIIVAYAVLGALVHRARTGRRQDVEVPIFKNMVSYVMAEHLWGMIFDPAIGGPGYAPLISPERRPVPTKDGYVSILTSPTPIGKFSVRGPSVQTCYLTPGSKQWWTG